MDERTLVHGWRARGFSWQACATNLRRCVEDVRRDHDPTYVGPASRQEPARPTFRAKPTLVPPIDREPKPKFSFWRDMKKGERRRLIMTTLYHAKVPIGSTELGGATACNVVMALRNRYGEGIIRSKQNVGYWLTAEGRTVFEKHFAQAEAA